MDERADTPDNVVDLRAAPAVEEPPADVSSPGRLHAAGIFGMALCAVAGIVALIARITVGWPGNSDRYVMAVFVFAGIGFLASASVAVFSAARETYPHRLGPPEED